MTAMLLYFTIFITPKVSCFLKNCYHSSYKDNIFCAGSVDPTQQICATIMSVLL